MGVSEYRVTTVDVPSRHRGGVAIFYRESTHFMIEAHQQHIPNAISFHLALGGPCWFIVGCYLATDGASYIACVVTAIGKRPQVTALLVSGNYTTDLVEPK